MKSGLFVIFLTLAGNGLAESTLALPVSEARIVERYLQATRQQQTTLLGASMEVDIDASVPKLQRKGKLHALRNISKLGKITYHMLGFDGDASVKKDVIARYLSAEVEAQTGPNLGITPENYKFKLKGTQAHDGHEHYVVSVSPRKKAVGLFKGELWLDEATCMPIREAGRFVKSPSVFLTRMEFIRTYELLNGVSIPQRIESKVDTRLFGPVALSISFSNFAKDPESEVVAFASLNEAEF